jgi:hypothetical protein
MAVISLKRVSIQLMKSCNRFSALHGTEETSSFSAVECRLWFPSAIGLCFKMSSHQFVKQSEMWAKVSPASRESQTRGVGCPVVVLKQPVVVAPKLRNFWVAHVLSIAATTTDIWCPTMGMCERSNIDITQRYQNKVLRCLVNALWYARNSDIHRELGVETVASITARHAISHGNRLQHHVNDEASRLLNVQHLIRWLKRTKPFELVKQFDN